jgi:predicted SnoaL-like aldol condensation-catalyzing enzyme
MVSPPDAALVQRVIDEILNAGDLDLADELFGLTYINHGGLIPDLVRGPEGVKFSVALYRRAFPELQISADDIQTSGDTVTLRWTARSTTQTGPGASINVDQAAALKGSTRISVAGGQIVESWTSWNAAKVLEGMGIFQPGDDETS